MIQYLLISLKKWVDISWLMLGPDPNYGNIEKLYNFHQDIDKLRSQSTNVPFQISSNRQQGANIEFLTA